VYGVWTIYGQQGVLQ